jgi:uncharacterized protein YllA (UPF0747 family)
VQDTLLPTASYVAGPGELAYFAQMAGVYERFGTPMPLIAPRATMTLVEPSIRRALDALGIDVEDVVRGVSLGVVLEREAPAVDRALTEAEAAVDDSLARAAEAVRSLDGSLERAAGAAAARARKALSTLRLKTERVARRRRADEEARMRRVEAALRPAGKLQERALSALGVYARYGPQLSPLLDQAIDLDAREHIVVDLP